MKPRKKEEESVESGTCRARPARAKRRRPTRQSYTQDHKRARKQDTERPSTSSGPVTMGRQPSCGGENCHPGASKDNSDLEIPGFYFDKEKNRFFKIASQQNATTGAITREKIEEKASEEKRQKDLKRIYTDIKINRTVKSCVKCFPQMVMQRSYGNVFKEQLTSMVIKEKASSLKSVLRSQLVFTGQNPAPIRQGSLENMLQMEVNPKHDKILGLWSLKETWVHHIQLMDIKEQFRKSERESLCVKVKPCGTFISQSLTKVTHMCWASPAGLSEEDHQNVCLYTTMCPTGYSHSLALIRHFEAKEGQPCAIFDVSLGRKATWTCAWNRHLGRFSVGTEKNSLIIEPETRKMWEFDTQGSDPLSQVFSNQNGHFLYSGTRRGQILTHDLRSSSTRSCFSPLRQKSSVCSLSLLQNDVDLLAADFSGMVCLWDLRMRRVVVEYLGHRNEYKILPMHVDEHEKLVYGAGQDGYVRFWWLRSGDLLNEIPPPVLVSKDFVPAVRFSMRWGNKPGNGGMVMGLRDKLHFYGSLPVD